MPNRSLRAVVLAAALLAAPHAVAQPLVQTGPLTFAPLVRKVIPNLLSPQAPNPDVEVICRGVGGFNLRYYDGTQWNDTWDSTQQQNVLPNAVEVTLTLDRPNGPIVNADGSHAFRFTHIIPMPCSTIVGTPGSGT